MRLQVGLGRPHIEPVALERRPVDGTFRGEPREDLPLDRDRVVLGNAGERLRLEDVQPRVDEVGVDLLGTGLLEEGLDAAVVGDPHEAVPARVRHGRQQDRRLRPARAMEADELGEVRLAQRVAVQREEAPLEAAGGERDPPARAERLRLDGVLEGEIAVAVAEGCGDLVRQVAAGDDRALDAVPCEVLERVREERAVDERQHVLPRRVREGPQAGPLAAHEDDRGQAHRPTVDL